MSHMSFLCVCMSPALDATVVLPEWPTDGSISKVLYFAQSFPISSRCKSM